MEEQTIKEIIELKNFLQVGEITLASNELSYQYLVSHMTTLLNDKSVRAYLKIPDEKKSNGNTKYTE